MLIVLVCLTVLGEAWRRMKRSSNSDFSKIDTKYYTCLSLGCRVDKLSMSYCPC